MDGRPAPSAHANGSATAAQASAVASRAPESNGNGAHVAQQCSDDHEDSGAAAPLSAAPGEAVGGPKQPVGLTTSSAAEHSKLGSQKGMVPALATTASDKKKPAVAAAVVSPFIAARVTKQADPHAANSYTVVAAAHTTLESATSGMLPTWWRAACSDKPCAASASALCCNIHSGLAQCSEPLPALTYAGCDSVLA